jgi:hypothetical protein
MSTFTINGSPIIDIVDTLPAFSASDAGRFLILSTDTSKIYRNNGAAWVQVVFDANTIAAVLSTLILQQSIGSGGGGSGGGSGGTTLTNYAKETGGNLTSILTALQGTLTTKSYAPSAFLTGQKVLSVAGTAQQIFTSSTTLLNGLVVTAGINNTGTILVGIGNTITNTNDGTGNGYPLSPGQSISIPVADASTIWFNGTITNDIISYFGN